MIRRNTFVGTLDVQIFEHGRVYRSGGEGGLAVEEAHLGIALCGALGGTAWTGSGAPCDFSTIKGVLEELFERLGIAVEHSRLVDDSLLHPGRAARLVLDGEPLGVVGEIHPAIASELEVPLPLALAELDVARLALAVTEQATFAGLSLFPPVRQDIAVVVPDSVEAEALLATAQAAGGDLLASVHVFDVFADAERVGDGRVSIALRLVFQAEDRTLTEEEASAVREQVAHALVDAHGAELRG